MFIYLKIREQVSSRLLVLLRPNIFTITKLQVSSEYLGSGIHISTVTHSLPKILLRGARFQTIFLFYIIDEVAQLRYGVVSANVTLLCLFYNMR